MRAYNFDTMQVAMPPIFGQKNKVENVKPVTPTQNGTEMANGKKSPSVSQMDLTNRPDSVERF